MRLSRSYKVGCNVHERELWSHVNFCRCMHTNKYCRHYGVDRLS